MAWTAPALAESDVVVTYPGDKGKRFDYPLKPGKTLTLKLKAGTSNTTLDHKFTPTQQAVGGHFARGEVVNATLENSQASYPFPDTSTITMKCKMTLKDVGQDGWVVYKNASDGDLILHIN